MITTGTALYVRGDHVGVRIDGETVVHEWPAERVWEVQS